MQRAQSQLFASFSLNTCIKISLHFKDTCKDFTYIWWLFFFLKTKISPLDLGNGLSIVANL